MNHFQTNSKTAEKAPNLSPAETVRLLRSRALACRVQGNHRKAESLYLQALRLLERAVGPNHPNLVPLLNSLARTCEDQGEYAKAEQFYQRSVGILDGVEGKLE